MQRQILDKANVAALRVHGRTKILVALVNIPERRPNCVTLSQEFLESYGPLRPGHPLPRVDTVDAAKAFRRAWVKKTKDDVEVLERFLEWLFTLKLPKEPYGRPAVRLDFLAGRWEPSPRTLVEHLAVELVHSRNMLHRCERPQCRRYFVKEFSRARYCSNSCSDEMRTKGQTNWALDHREELNAKRRKLGKKPRQRKSA
jgi:hypothetical protein